VTVPPAGVTKAMGGGGTSGKAMDGGASGSAGGKATGGASGSAGRDRIAWAAAQMPVLARIGERFVAQQPLRGNHVAACLHITAETANLVRVLCGGGADVTLCAANPLATQDDVVAALKLEQGVSVDARRGDDFARYEAGITDTVARVSAAGGRWLALDDGGELLAAAHRDGATAELFGGTEETSTGLTRLRRLHAETGLSCPVLALNEALTERELNDRHGTGQSALDGIIRATNLLLAGRGVVVIGYGRAGQGVAERARGGGAVVIVCETDPLRALAARMAGYAVMPIAEAAASGDVFITVTGERRVLRTEHFELMKDGAVLANAGRFDVELDLEALRRLDPEPRRVRPLVDQYTLSDGRRLNLLALGQVVNLAAADGYPAAVMDISFSLHALAVERLLAGPPLAPGIQPVPLELDREVAGLKLASLGVAFDAPAPEGGA
jgi:adenosylhomocysteinase